MIFDVPATLPHDVIDHPRERRRDGTPPDPPQCRYRYTVADRHPSIPEICPPGEGMPLCSLGSPVKRGDPAFDQLTHSLKLRLCVIHHPSLAVSSSQEIHGHLVYFPGLRCYI